MSISVSRESISKLMTELVDSFPMEGEGRASISDFGKLLFTEGQTTTSSSGSTRAPSTSASATKDSDSDDDESSTTESKTPTGTKRVFTEIKGVPRQKQHDIMKSKDKAVPKRWTNEEDERLRDAVNRHGERNWKSIAEEVPGRNHTQCLQRWTKVLAPGLVKGHWRPDEDELLKELVAEGRKNWGQVATRIPGRTSKQCRERWYNHLDPSIVRGEYTAEEDRIILDAQSRLGNRWSAIAAMLPGRTEDAVKIRWKSLCRVRKGQGRRAQGEKGKNSPKEMDAMGDMQAMSGAPMMMANGHPGGFAGNLVKSDEVASFSAMPPPQIVRLPSGQLVAGYASGVQPMQTTGMMAGPPPPSMMYASEMSQGGYDPTMAHYRKPPMSQPHVVVGGGSYGHGLPPSVPTMAPANGQVATTSMMGLPSPSHAGYSQPYTMGVTSYAADMSGNMYPTVTGGMASATGAAYGSTPGPQMAMYRPAMMMSPQVSPHHQAVVGTVPSPHQQQMMMAGGAPSYSYGLPPTPTNGGVLNVPNGGVMQGFNPAAAFVQQQQQPSPQQQQYVNQPVASQQLSPSESPAEREQPEAPPSPPIAKTETIEPVASTASAVSSSEGSGATANPVGVPNPAAMFARMQAKAQQSPASSSGQPAMGGNPVAAFLKQQQLQKRKDSSSSSVKPLGGGGSSSGSGVKPFNPALAFAQRMQPGPVSSQRPPIPISSSSTKSSEGTADEDEDGESGDKSNEPSLKKVKPRLSIDAARASAARRLRNSGSGAALAGRGSLDVFLNEIGDVGRLSDLKMDEFQTLDELWRVSGDMDRLSL